MRACSRASDHPPVLRFSSQGSPLSLSRSSSREGIGNGSDSVNWRERNGAANGLSAHTEFPSSVSSPKRKQNKSGQCKCTAWCVRACSRACSPVFLSPSMDSCGALPQQQQLHGLHLLVNGQQRLQPALVSERLRPAGALQQPRPGEVHGRLPAAGGSVEPERHLLHLHTWLSARGRRF